MTYISLSDLNREIKEALWGCLEIPLYLKNGATRFSGTVSAFKRSLLVPVLLIPLIIYLIPRPEAYEGKSVLWEFNLMFIQVMIGNAAFAGVIYFFKAKNSSREDFLRCITAYNWLSLSALVVNIPLILLGIFELYTWPDVLAMMMLITIYSYTFLAFMITHTLRTNVFLGISFTLADIMLSEIIRSLTTYFMQNNF